MDDDVAAADKDEAIADSANEDVLRLARIAIFCSAFGAAILLAVAMCVLNGSPPPPPTALKNLIRVNLFVLDPPKSTAVPVRINLKIAPPGGTLIDLPLDKMVNGRPFDEFRKWGDVRAVGLTLRNDIVVAPSPDGWVGQLLIVPKVPGPWRFAAWWGNGGVADGEDSPTTGRSTVHLHMVISSNESDSSLNQELNLRYGIVSDEVGAPK